LGVTGGRGCGIAMGRCGTIAVTSSPMKASQTAASRSVMSDGGPSSMTSVTTAISERSSGTRGSRTAMIGRPGSSAAAYTHKDRRERVLAPTTTMSPATGSLVSARRAEKGSGMATSWA
jgi:hypothetical protein